MRRELSRPSPSSVVSEGNRVKPAYTWLEAWIGEDDLRDQLGLVEMRERQWAAWVR
jgi:hypothetical protein